jgi:hypothetical protein
LTCCFASLCVQKRKVSRCCECELLMQSARVCAASERVHA